MGALLTAGLSGCSPTRPTPTPAALTVTCDATALTSVGQQAHCTVRATLSDGSTEDRTATAAWSSSDTSTLTVAAGVATAVASGRADVTAKVDTLSAVQTLNVALGCAFSLSPATLSFGPAGGSQVVSVNAAPAGCATPEWTASVNNPELTVLPTSGSGSGSVTLTVAPNSGAAQTWTATIAGQTFTANVSPACTYAFAPLSPDSGGDTWQAPASGGDRIVAVTVTGTACVPWTATSADNWIAVSPTSGNSSATVKLSFAQNGGAARTGSVTFRPPNCSPLCGPAGVTVFVRQSAGTPVLTVTLEQGENLSGPYAGTVTGPNGFTCSIGQRERSVPCPAISFAAGTTVTLRVAVTIPGQSPSQPTIFRSTGCDSRPANDCTVIMTSDRSVTLAVGCAVVCNMVGSDRVVDARAIVHAARGRRDAGVPREPRQFVNVNAAIVGEANRPTDALR
jgi:hypothetical protein